MLATNAAKRMTEKNVHLVIMLNHSHSHHESYICERLALEFYKLNFVVDY